jgi:hypothetical protein
MDAQELRNLQEAYLEVVMNEAYQPFPKGKVDKKMASKAVRATKHQVAATWGDKNKSSENQEKANKLGSQAKHMAQISTEKNKEANARSRGIKSKHRSEVKKRIRYMDDVARQQRERGYGGTAIKKEEIDIYDLILSYLLDEGYVETPEAAEAIMVNMSEEWRDSILLEKKKQYDDGHGFDRSKHPDLEIDYDRPRGKDQNRDIRGYTRITHRPSGITYEINHDEKHGKYNTPSDLKGKARKAHGHKPEHDIRWDHGQSALPAKDMSRGEKIRTARNAKRVWDKHIQNRIPSGHLISNSPDDNYDDNRRNPDKNTRASIYRKSGFGNPNRMGKQYSTKIGNKFHPVNDDED